MRSNSFLLFLASSASIAAAAVIPGQLWKEAAVVPDQSWNPLNVLKRAALTGQGTYYGGNLQGGACSFSTYTLPTGIYGAATANWDNSANCGACITATGPDGNSITAMLVDQCPNCGTNHIDFFPDAFAALANPTLGVIDISWSYTDCPITTPIQLHNKEGVSAYWFSMQVVNANQAVESLEVSTDGGSTWQPTTRSDYNFFENTSGFGTTTVDVKVTSTSGEVVTVEGVQCVAGQSTTASGNFASGSSSSSSDSGSGSDSSAVSSSSTSAAVEVTPTTSAAAVEVTSTPSTTPTTSTAVAAVETTPVSSATPTISIAAPSTTAAQVTSAEAIVEISSTSPALASPTSTQTTSVIFVTVTSGRPTATGSADDSCYAEL